MSAVVEHHAPQAPSLLARFASRWGVEPNKMLTTLKATAFKGDVSNEQMMALIIVAEQHGLNPWTKEIYAFPDRQNGIVPVVGVDGWSRIINSHPEFDGMEFIDGPASPKDGTPEWIECVIHRKDRSHAIRAREYMAECRRDTQPWRSHPRRMLRHKAMIQCGRLAFSLAGIYDPDEAERIVDMGQADQVTQPAVTKINEKIRASRAQAVDASVVEPAENTVAVEPEPEQASAPAEVEPTVTFAQVAAALNKARSADTLDVAADLLIGQVADEAQRAELADLYQQRKALADRRGAAVTVPPVSASPALADVLAAITSATTHDALRESARLAGALDDDGKKQAREAYKARKIEIEGQADQSVADAPATESEAPAVTFAQVADALQKAKSIDTLAVAADLIGEVADEGQRAELTALFEERQAKLAQ